MRAERKERAAVTPPLTKPTAFPARIIAPGAGIIKKNLEEILAADIVAVFLVRAPEVDVVSLGLRIAEEGQRLRVSA